MGQIRTILQETRDDVLHMKRNAGNNWLERAQFTCQLWNLDRMIDIANGIHNIRRRIRGKGTQNER